MTNQSSTLIQFAKSQSTVLWRNQLFLHNLWGSPFLFSFPLWKQHRAGLVLSSCAYSASASQGLEFALKWRSLREWPQRLDTLSPFPTLILYVGTSPAASSLGESSLIGSCLGNPCLHHPKETVSCSSNFGRHVHGPAASSANLLGSGTSNDVHRSQLSQAPGVPDLVLLIFPILLSKVGRNNKTRL